MTNKQPSGCSRVDFAHSGQQAGLTLDDVLSRADKQECASTVGTLGFSFPETLITNERRLLVSCQPGNLYTLECAMCNLAVHFGSRGKLGQYRCLEAKEPKQDGVPVECAQVHEQRAGCVRHVRNVYSTICSASKTLVHC
jgi:hypothetical protein